METSGQWLEKALVDLCKRVESGLDLDREVISGLVSYCEFAQPVDAKEYLDNIIGTESAKGVIEEYLRRRGHLDTGSNASAVQDSKFQAYVKPATEKNPVGGTKKQFKAPKDVLASSQLVEQKKISASGYGENREANQVAESIQKGLKNGSRKKKTGKVISLAEAAKGSIVFQKGKPCSCQARQHRLVGNCLSCGKIVCEQEGEGPCGFCGALVLGEGSTYAGLEDTLAPASDAEAAAEAYAKRLVDYDRNAAARTTVFDDQSDYYEIDSNSWLSQEEKELLKKKQEELEEAEKAKRSKVVVTFDLVGRKVLLNQDDDSELEAENRILRLPDQSKREVHRIKPNPTLRIQPIFLDPGSNERHDKTRQQSKTLPSGLCLEITGRVQHESN